MQPKTIRHLMFVAVVTILAGPALAAKEAKIGGVGARKCTEWNDWKSQKNGEARAVGVEWARGFIAGHNLYQRAEASASQVSPDATTVATLIDNYCEKLVDQPLFYAVIDMVKRLGGASVNLVPKSGQGRSGGGRGDGKAEL
jgi:hypothetical protein